ncbi:MAG: tetratricopeptide repeat protein [Pyrinomonadaceae bacterium]
MTKTCPACGFVSNAEARFCRMCGAMLPRASNDLGEGEVSPSASTVPLSLPRPGTDALSPHDTGAPNRAPTDSIRRAEFEDFLRSVAEDADAAQDDSGAPGERPLTIRVRPLDNGRPATDADSDARSSSTLAAERAAPPAAPDAPTVSPPSADETSAPLSSPLAASSSNAASSPGVAATPVVSASANAAASANIAPPADAAANAEVAAARPSPTARPARTTEARALRLWAGAAVFAVVAALVAAGVFGTWYFVKRRREARASSSVASASASADARQAAQAKLAEADQLLASGRTSEAVARLREAAALDPANAEPHRRLARLLVEEGARRTAIEELLAVVRIDASDAAAWRSLAEAQASEGLYADAAESYHALFGVSTDAERDDRLQLAYADALRLAGRATEAQSLYKRLATSHDAEIARASRKQLATAGEAAKNANANANNANAARVAATNSTVNTTATNATPARAGTESSRANAAENSRADAGRASAASRPSPLPASASPGEHYGRGVELWRANRSAALAEFATAAQGGNPDASYYLGLNLAEGRDPRTLKRAELVAALTYFQRARRSHFASDARRYEDSLGREYDRRRNEER